MTFNSNKASHKNLPEKATQNIAWLYCSLIKNFSDYILLKFFDEIDKIGF